MMDRFIQRQNIDHYQWLLQSGQIDDTQRRTIARLLAKEARLAQYETPKKEYQVLARA